MQQIIKKSPLLCMPMLPRAVVGALEGQDDNVKIRTTLFFQAIICKKGCFLASFIQDFLTASLTISSVFPNLHCPLSFTHFAIALSSSTVNIVSLPFLGTLLFFIFQAKVVRGTTCSLLAFLIEIPFCTKEIARRLLVCYFHLHSF